MNDENLCPNCSETVENGAVFCGNCGAKIGINSIASQVYFNGVGTNNTAFNIPAYAIPHSHHKQHWAAMAMAIGVLGIGGGLLIPILGISFGLAGVVLSTSSFRITHGWLKSVGFIASAMALLLSLAIYVNNVVHNPKLAQPTQAGTSNGIASINVTTPCYSLSFDSELNVNNDNGSCTMNAYNGTSLTNSSDIFKVIATQVSNVNSTNFDSVAKQSIEADFSKNLPSFNITSEQSNLFAGSSAYIVQAYSQSNNIAFSEEDILHGTSLDKDNYFVIVHGTNGPSASLSNLQKSWQWNE